MKKIIYTLVSIFLFSFSLVAQTGDIQELALTQEQTEKYLDIQRNIKQSMLALEPMRKSNNPNYADLRDDIFNKADKNIKSLLNDKQWAVYDRLRKQRNKTLEKIN